MAAERHGPLRHLIGAAKVAQHLRRARVGVCEIHWVILTRRGALGSTWNHVRPAGRALAGDPMLTALAPLREPAVQNVDLIESGAARARPVTHALSTVP
jgi:hypothetical protein